MVAESGLRVASGRFERGGKAILALVLTTTLCLPTVPTRAYAGEGDSAGSSEVTSADISQVSLGEENPGEVLDALLGSETDDEAAKSDIPAEGMLSVEPAEVSDSGEGGLEELEVADGESVSDAPIEGEEVSLLDSYPSLSALVKSVPEGADEGKVRFVNERLATHVRVDTALGNGVGASDRLQAAEGVVSAGAGDAAAVAFAFQAVMDELGIPCLCVQTDDGSRVWNLAQVGGAWSHVDVAANAEAFAECDGTCAGELTEETGHRCFEAYCMVDAEALGLPGDAAAFEAVEGFELPTGKNPYGDEASGRDFLDEPRIGNYDIGNTLDEDVQSPEKDSADAGFCAVPPDGAKGTSGTGEISSWDIAGVIALYAGGWTWPVPGYGSLSQGYGGSNNHEGIDIPAPAGKPVVAARAGTVVAINMDSSYGNAVAILHDGGYSTFYCHLSSRAVGVGATVQAGQVVGYVGSTGNSTGNHLHFRLNTNATKTNFWGTKQNPLNYVSYSSVPSHTHSYPVASYYSFNSHRHRVTYSKCSCGATKAEEQEAHDFQWHGLTKKCTKCGTIFDNYTDVMEYFTNKQTTLYQGAGYNQKALKTIPVNTVVKPLEAPRDYAPSTAGWYQLKVSYGGATGYIWASDVTPNNNGGVHNWKNGKCTQCGIEQPPSSTGTYRVTANKVAYKENAMRGEQKQLKPGDYVVVTRVQTSTMGYLWGWTSDGYTLAMNSSDMKLTGAFKQNGTVATIPDGVYLVRSAANTLYNIDIPSSSTSDRTALQLFQDNGANAQKFTFKKTTDGSYIITNVNSNKAWDVAGSSMAQGATVWQYSTHGSAGQRWFIERTSSGAYSFRNVNSNQYLDVWNGEVKNYAKLQQYPGNGSLAQQFYIEPVSKGSLAQQANNVVSITGINSSYTYTGVGIAPVPTVRKRIWAADSLRVPVSGTPGASQTHVYRDDTVKLKAGRTYVLEVGAISHDAGNGTAVVALAYDFGANKTVAPDMVFSYSTKTQYKTFTPSTDCTLIFYSGKNGACGGNASTWKNVRVYETLKANTDYKVTYRGNVNAGKAYVDVTGINGYSDVRSTPFAIAAKAATPTITLSAASYAYNGQAREPGVTVKVGGRTLKSGTDYTVSYSNNVKPGTATVRVTLKGNYSGSGSKAFTIKDNVPSAPASKNGWAKSVGGTWYYYQAGSLAKGWQRVGGTWYYLDPSTGAMATGWKSVGGAWYYLKDWGGMAEGWELVGGTWYYLEPGSGAMATGWERVGGTWYYLKGSGAMAEGWQRVGGTWYYLNPGSGAMAEGWAYVGGDWYYLEPGTGAMLTGWYQVGGEWYCSDSSGRMLANCWVDGTYWVGPSGAMATSSWVDGNRYWVGPDGRWAE